MFRFSVRQAWYVGGMCAVLCTSTAGAQEWTRFRGPNGTGLAPAIDLPAQWTAADVKWKVALPAGGHSSPVIWGDQVFLTGADDQTSALRTVFSLSTKDGSLLWTRSYPSQFHRKHKFSSFAACTPAVDAERVYVCWSAPDEFTLLALDHKGQEVWRRNLGPYVSQHSCGTSPIVYKEMVILQGEQDLEGGGKSFVIAVNKQTGETVWQVDRPNTLVPYSTPIVRKNAAGKDEILVNSSKLGVTALDPATGKLLWTSEGVIDKRSVSSPVLTAEGLVTASCGSGGGGNFLVTVKPEGPQAGTMVYKVDKMAPYVPTPLAYKNWLFLWADNGIVTCLKSDTGDVLWRERVGGNYFSSPICIGNRLYNISTDGEVVVLAADGTFQDLGRNPLGEQSHATPAVSGGRLYIRTYTHLMCVGGKPSST